MSSPLYSAEIPILEVWAKSEKGKKAKITKGSPAYEVSALFGRNPHTGHQKILVTLCSGISNPLATRTKTLELKNKNRIEEKGNQIPVKMNLRENSEH